MSKIKVLIIDDSALIRRLLQDILSQFDDIQVVGVAHDAYDAREKIKRLQPDVLTLDIEMPRMNGLVFLKNLMRLRPMPVIMISTLTEEGAPATLEALEIGAIDYIPKPRVNLEQTMTNYAEELHQMICTAAHAHLRTQADHHVPVHPHTKITNLKQVTFRQNALIAIGASTGGTEAIKEVITRFPAHFPPVIIVQHIPPAFSTSFAARMDKACKMTVFEAQHKQKIAKGCIYIAPGNQHLSVKQIGNDMYCILSNAPRVNRHRPSVDVLFNSIAVQLKKQAIGVILTGMGNDGAQGLLNMRRHGAKTLAQDQSTCVVWGMPRAAIELKAAEKVAPLFDIADITMRLAKKKINS